MAALARMQRGRFKIREVCVMVGFGWWRHEQNWNSNPHVNAVNPCARCLAASALSVQAQFGQPSQTKTA
jgi:hypothetical protein